MIWCVLCNLMCILCIPWKLLGETNIFMVVVDRSYNIAIYVYSTMHVFPLCNEINNIISFSLITPTTKTKGLIKSYVLVL